MYVTNLKSGTLSRQTSRSQSRHTTFMGHFGQRIRLVHKLRQSIRPEECIDYRRNSLGINQIDRCKYLIVPNVHTFTYCTWHTSQSDTKLVIQLFTYSSYTTVTQVVDIINIGLRINQLNKIFDNLDNILFRQDLYIGRSGQIQFFIDSITSYLTQVISLFREE